MKSRSESGFSAIFIPCLARKTNCGKYSSLQFSVLSRISRAKEIIILAGLLLAVHVPAQTPYYYLNRSFSSVQFDLQDIPTEYQLNEESDKLTDIVKGEIKTNNCYAIEKQEAISICYGSILSAWAAVTNYNGTPSNYPGKIFDNVGWVRGVKAANGEWGAYLWVLQNRIEFQASTSAWWSISNGIPVAITNVMVGSLGDYQPTTTNVDIGPKIPSNYPFANCVGTYQVDITNVYYELIIPDIWITPRFAVVAAGGSNVQYTVTGTNIPNGVTWSLIPDLSGSDGAAFQTNGAWQAEIIPGSVGTNYIVRANSKDNTNFYDQVSLTVCKIEVANIKFNHNTGSSTNDGINIRQDYNTPYDISNGEWVKGGTNIPACYTTNKAVTIKARLITTPDVNIEADIWAVSTDSGGSLGDVIKTNVSFSGGVSSPEYVTFQISGTTPNCVKKTTTDTWEWKMGNVNGSGSAACALNTSSIHTIYTILNEPASPWDNTAGTQKNAWTKVFDYSCDWANTATDETNIVANITTGAYLGFGKTYDGYQTHTTNNGLCHLSTMMAASVVDCRDMSAVVELFSRILGGATVQVRRLDGPFYYKPILAIGSSTWANSGWNFHQFGWHANSVHDACVKLKESAPYVPVHDDLNGNYKTNLYDSGTWDPLTPDTIMDFD